MSNTRLKSEALALLQQKKYADAKVMYADVCKTDPADVDAWHMLSAINGMLGLFEESEQCARKVIKLTGGIVPAYNNLGSALFEQGKTNAAKSAFSKALKLDKKDPETLNNLGNIYLRKEEYEKAQGYYTKALSFRPDYAEAHNNLASAYLYLKMPENALNSLQSALQLNPRYLDALFNYGKALQELGRPEQALSAYNNVLQLQPDNKGALLGIGDLKLELGSFGDAIQCFESILGFDPSYTDAYVGLGFVYQKLRKPEQAIKNFSQAISIDSNRADVHHYLGTAHKEMDSISEAAECFKRALEIDPDFVQSSHMLAAIGVGPTPDEADSKYVAALFDKYADNFDEHLVSGLEYKTPEILCEMLTPVLGVANRQHDVLDLGCGTGLCAPIFVPWSKALVGVDLSGKMIERARDLDLYTELIVGDLREPLLGHFDSYDLILAADVFVYVGKLNGILQACSDSLRAGGILAFSVESLDDEKDYILHSGGRYAHTQRYIQDVADEVGLISREIKHLVLRKEKGKPVEGIIFMLEKKL